MSARSQRGWRRFFNPGTLASLFILFTLLVVRVYDLFPLETLRLGAFDFYQRLQPREVPATRPVVIVDIDESSLETLGGWPWPRHVLIRLTRTLAAAGSSAIVFDIIFAEPDRLSARTLSRSLPGLPDAVQRSLDALPDNDGLFAEAIKNAPVVLGMGGYWKETNTVPRPPLEKSVAVFGPKKLEFIPQVRSLVRAIPVLERAAEGHGLIALVADHDSITRRIPAVLIFQNRLYPALAIEALRVALKRKATVVMAGASGLVSVGLSEDLMMPVDRYGRIWPHFAERRSDLYVSAGDVLAGTIDSDRFKDKIVLIGTSAVGLGDVRATPITPALPGVEIHAQTIEAMLTKDVLQRPSYIDAAEVLLVSVAGLVLILGFAVTSVRWSLAVFLFLSGSVGILSWFLFNADRFLLDPAFPLMALFVLYMTCLTGRGLALERELRDRAGP